MNTFAALLVLWATAAVAADNVLVVANSQSALSKNVAEYYARKRGVPKSNVCYLRTTSDETIDRATYQRAVEAPVAECLRKRELVEKVLYIVTTADVPLRVKGSAGMAGDNAAVDSELTLLYSRLHGKRFATNGIVPNPFFRQTSAKFQHPDFPIYLVTRLAAYNFADVKALIDRSLAARNRGRFVLDAKSEGEGEGDSWLRDAAIALPSARTLFDQSAKVVDKQKDVIGYASWGSNDHARKTRTLGFSWLPGAIMTEFVSTNARTFRRPPASWNIGTWSDRQNYFAGAPQTLIGDYIAEGVTGVAGHVDEPYLAMTPRPELLLPAYYSGRNLAESFYLALPALSWQNVVIGDPLCAIGMSDR